MIESPPERKGRILLRVPADLHSSLASEAERQGVSLNLLAVSLLSNRPGPSPLQMVPRIALTQQEACSALGCSDEFFVEHIRPHVRTIRRGRKRLYPVDDLRRAIDELAEFAVS